MSDWMAYALIVLLAVGTPTAIGLWITRDDYKITTLWLNWRHPSGITGHINVTGYINSDIPVLGVAYTPEQMRQRYHDMMNTQPSAYLKLNSLTTEGLDTPEIETDWPDTIE